jgi:phage tail-like protein
MMHAFWQKYKSILKSIRRFVMSMFTVNTHRFDPYKDFKFRVKWDGEYIAGISKVSSLTRSTEPVTHRDGGDLSNVRIAPGLTKFDPIFLERGLSHDTAFEDWANLTFSIQGDADMSLKNYRKDIVIEIVNLQGTIVMAFIVYRCWVSDYQALPELDSNNNCIAIEKIILQHKGWERDKSIVEPAET